MDTPKLWTLMWDCWRLPRLHCLSAPGPLFMSGRGYGGETPHDNCFKRHGQIRKGLETSNPTFIPPLRMPGRIVRTRGSSYSNNMQGSQATRMILVSATLRHRLASYQLVEARSVPQEVEPPLVCVSVFVGDWFSKCPAQ